MEFNGPLLKIFGKLFKSPKISVQGLFDPDYDIPIRVSGWSSYHLNDVTFHLAFAMS